jgi:hypothetical protein
MTTPGNAQNPVRDCSRVWAGIECWRGRNPASDDLWASNRHRDLPPRFAVMDHRLRPKPAFSMIVVAVKIETRQCRATHRTR